MQITRSIKAAELPLNQIKQQTGRFLTPVKPQILDKTQCLFHGIAFDDLFKIPSIIEKGLFSSQAAKEKGITLQRTSKYAFNAADRVSLAEPEKKHRINANAFDAYALYIKHSLSFAINPKGVALVPDLSPIPGEVQVKDSIPSQAILGAMLPESFETIALSELPKSADSSKPIAVIAARALALYRFLAQTTGMHDAALETWFEEQASQPEVYGQKKELLKQMRTCFLESMEKKFEKPASQILYLDILRSLVPEGFPIYTSGGELCCEESSHRKAGGI